MQIEKCDSAVLFCTRDIYCSSVSIWEWDPALWLSLRFLPSPPLLKRFVFSTWQDFLTGIEGLWTEDAVTQCDWDFGQYK